MLLSGHSFKNWIPYKLIPDGVSLSCEWLYVGEEPFLEPSFDQTINRRKQLPENRDRKKNVSSLSTLLEWSEKIDAAETAGFIFHISRCGSTMVSQLLSTRRDHIVLAEVPFLDDLLRMPGKAASENAGVFKAAVKFYSQKRAGSENKVFIKTDSWHILFHKEIREVFPGVPFFLLYHRPDEVVRSLNKAPGMHCVPQLIDPQFFGIQDKVFTIQDFYNYPIKVIEKYLETYIDVLANDPNCFLLNYTESILPIIQKIDNITGIKFTETELEKMKERLLFHSKYPQTYFAQEFADRGIDDKFSGVFELYNRIEEIRINSGT